MNNGKIVFGQYYDSNSWLHRLDPRTKLISLLALIISLFIIDNIYVLLGFTVFLFGVICTTKTPINKFFKSIRMTAYILIFTFIIQLIVNKEGNLIASYNFDLNVLNLGIIVVSLILWIFLSKYIKKFRITLFILLIISLFVLQYYVHISPNITYYNVMIYEEGLIEASFIVIRIVDFLFISSLLTLTTKPTEINNGLDSLLKPLKKIGLNSSFFTMIIAITLRFIPTLILETEKILKAQASRGADFKEVNLISKISQMVSLIIPLFVITYKKAIDLTYAMEARAYVDNKERSSLYELKYQTADYITFVLDICLVVFCIISRIVI
jgi:energy-coupling factor transport system permease protein